MNKIAVTLTLIASFLIMLTAGIFTQIGFSYQAGGCYVEKVIPPLPYTRQVFCHIDEVYLNGTVISTKRVIYWCYGGTIYGGPTSGHCIVHNPSGKETAASTGNPLASEPIKNESSQLKQLLPTEPDSGSKSTDDSQLKQLIPIEPKEDAKTDKGVSGDSNKDNEEIDSADK